MLSLAATPACIISGTDVDNGTGEGSTGSGDASASGGTDDPTDDSESDSASDPTDDPTDDPGGSSSGGADGSSSGDPTAGGDGPESGEWIYSDDGATQNDCTFLGNPSQGLGDFVVDNPGDGTFTITPGDDTDPFECELGEAGNFGCPERYVESITEPGVAATLDAFVAASGTTTATSMTGEQAGRITCDGADCALAEAALETSFPCSFVIPFTATR